MEISLKKELQVEKDKVEHKMSLIYKLKKELSFQQERIDRNTKQVRQYTHINAYLPQLPRGFHTPVSSQKVDRLPAVTQVTDFCHELIKLFTFTATVDSFGLFPHARNVWSSSMKPCVYHVQMSRAAAVLTR